MSVWRDIITPVTAEVLYEYDDPFYNQAAVTKISLVAGRFIM
ncbi:hypothetical protein AAAC51_11560 [Priestia megaterium]